jgi:hypothetical protein
LGAGLAIAMGLVAWKLSSGPISLSFLTPHFERILSEIHPDIRVRLDDTILTWGGWSRALDIRVINTRALDPLGTVLASVPELSLSLSVPALTHGVLAPKRVELLHPALSLIRLRDGRLQVSLGGGAATAEGGPDAFTRMLQHLAEPPNPGQPLSYLARIDILDANLSLQDQMLGVSWRAPAARLRVRRDAAVIQGELAFDLDVDGEAAHVQVLGNYRTKERQLDLGADFQGLRPSLFARLAPALAPIAALDLPMRGKASVSLSADGGMEAIGLDVTGGNGTLALPAPLAQRIAVKGATLKGRAGGTEDSLVVEALTVEFAEDAKLLLPPPTNHAMPVRGLSLAGHFLGRSGEGQIESLEVDLAGPRLSVVGSATGIGGPDGTALKAHATLTGTRTDLLWNYWPKAWGTDAYTWCRGHLSEGGVSRAEADVALRLTPDGRTVLESLSGDMDIEDVTVDYLPPMPKARKVHGRATFDTHRFDIALHRGEVRDQVLKSGTVFLTGLNEKDQFADIELFVDGPVKGALELIEHKPLGFASALGVSPGGARGTASTRLKLDFILEKTLTMDQVEVGAQSTLKDLRLANAVLGREVADGDLDLRVDKRGMDVKGTIKVADLPADLIWRRNFGNQAAIVSHYDLRGRIHDIRKTEDLGLSLGPFAGDYVRGAADLVMQFTQFKGGRSRLKASGDLKDMSVDVPAIDWYKSLGVPGTAEISLAMQGDTVTEIDHFGIQAKDLRVAGSATYSQSGTGLEKLRFDRVAFGDGRTDMRGTVEPRADGGWKVALAGPSLDLGRPIEEMRKVGKDERQPWDSLSVRFDLDLDTLWIARDRKLRKIKGSLEHTRDLWRTVALDGQDEGGRAFRVRIAPGEGAKRTVSVHSEDGGTFLKTLGFYENMQGGTLDLTGQYDDGQPGSPLSGKLEIKEYRVRNAPVLAHVVSLAAITGILDGLQGEGIGFLKLEAPFVYRDGLIEVTEAKSSGLSLGFTASGKIYTAGDALDIQGTIVPAYAINAFWGSVPVLGELLTGGEKGGGVFAARYRVTGPSDKPDVSVNPLSALAPGFLRNLFDIFETAKEGEANGAAVPAPARPASSEGPSGGL